MDVEDTHWEDTDVASGGLEAAPEDDPSPAMDPGNLTQDDSDEHLSAKLGPARASEELGVETRQRMAGVAAALFDEPPIPVKIGRFTIIRKLGAGGMGVVYVAYDEQLDRRVAVKLLRNSDTDTIGRARLHREAQAMARLSHPNVVTVHEVDSHEGQIFVAMEFVDGLDLRGWFGERQRSWPEVVEVFCQAGEGLAAAHEAGIVHRDFKPDNVLVGRDGRVRVADFGLAHAIDVVTPPGPDAADSETQLGTTLTRTGALMGTPAYMAPEQYAGTKTDGRSDQFAFCVALWEGIYGERPFSGQNLGQLSKAITEAKLGQVPESSEVPDWLEALLRRGLSAEPEDRWPSMRELLEVLGDDPRTRRLRRLRATALSVVVALALAGTSLLAATQLRHNARQRYWSALTEQLLELERARGFRQVSDDATRARDATRMSVFRNFRPGDVAMHKDATVAALLLREVEGPARESEAWISAANEILGQPISRLVLRGHSSVITAMVFGTDGELLYTGDRNGEVWRWELARGIGEPIITHEKEVTSLSLSGDGRTLASGSEDGRVLLWSADEQTVRTLTTHAKGVKAVEFSPDGRRVLSASRDGYAWIHEHDSERVVSLDAGSPIFSACFDADGQRVLTTSKDNTASVWRADDGALIERLVGHEHAVWFGRFVGPQEVVTASDDGTVRAWKLGGEQPAVGEILADHAKPISALAVHEGRFASAATDGSVRIGALRSAAGPRPLAELATKHDDDVWALVFTPDGKQVVSASMDTSARLLDVEGRARAREFQGHRLGVFGAAIDRSGHWLATGSWNGTVRVWDLTRPAIEIPLVGHSDKVFSVDIDARGERAVTASHDGSARVWRLSDGASLQTLSGHDSNLNAVVFSPDGLHVATAGKEGVALWDLPTGEARALRGHAKQVWRVDFDDLGEHLASASADRTGRVWTVATGASLVLRGHGAEVVDVAFRPGGVELATASQDGSVKLWSARSGALLATLPGDDSKKLRTLAWSPDGRLLASTATGGGARLWERTDLDHPLLLRADDRSIWSIVFEPNGERLATAADDGIVRIWDTRSGEQLTSFGGHSETIWASCFTPGGRVITGSNDNTIRIASISPSDPTRGAIMLSAHEAEICDLALSPDASVLVSASTDHSAKIWRLDRLSMDTEQLRARLWQATSACLTAQQRIRELGEDLREAESAFAACEQHFGRRPSPTN